MSHKIGVSGSTILSNPEHFLDLFLDDIEHIEIGEFPNDKALIDFLELYKNRKISLGIHAPLISRESKYDLIEKLQYDPEFAWNQLEVQSRKMAAIDAKYILVHFPYFKEASSGDVNKLIEEGLYRLNKIQQRYSIEIVCEPKLGLNRSAAGINYLDSFPIDIWKKYDIKLCIDIGDYIIAAGNNIISYISKWSDFIKVVHLHNVIYEEDSYIWTPVHPTQEHIEGCRIDEIIEALTKSKDVIFVFEHTPDTNPSKEYVNEGYKWIRSLLNKYS
ncbi:MAG: hypothetical protein K0R84_1831 [Clostridia bacterium]|jgi:sugar phosphate isomerase/epimerase|nr:hypothetical protein [Clostridia bacterium]